MLMKKLALVSFENIDGLALDVSISRKNQKTHQRPPWRLHVMTNNHFAEQPQFHKAEVGAMAAEECA
jgi:hypothetical protein